MSIGLVWRICAFRIWTRPRTVHWHQPPYMSAATKVWRGEARDSTVFSYQIRHVVCPVLEFASLFSAGRLLLCGWWNGIGGWYTASVAYRSSANAKYLTSPPCQSEAKNVPFCADLGVQHIPWSPVTWMGHWGGFVGVLELPQRSGNVRNCLGSMVAWILNCQVVNRISNSPNWQRT